MFQPEINDEIRRPALGFAFTHPELFLDTQCEDRPKLSI
jgi:hypothetical protein